MEITIHSLQHQTLTLKLIVFEPTMANNQFISKRIVVPVKNALCTPFHFTEGIQFLKNETDRSY